MKPLHARVMIALALAGFTLLVYVPSRAIPPDPKKLALKYDVRILRDTWGVPHIFGKKDTDAAFGLAYAHAEDDFYTIQLVLTAVSGKLATVLGPVGAGNDYLVHLIRLWDTVNEKYETDLSPEVRAICEAYADGINYYAALHPDEAHGDLYPVSGKHVVAGFVHKMPLMVGVDMVLKNLFETHPKTAYHPSDLLLKTAFNSDTFSKVGIKVGSNAIAVSPQRAADGKTFLAVNSHQPWEGPVTWYEVQVHSDEGWNMTGGLFPGSPVVFHGHNENLGWAHTNNNPDLIDVYALEMNPDDPDQYRYDGKWLTLEVRDAPIKVKLLGFLKWTFHKEVLYSVYGPVIRRPHGVYAIRYAGMGDVRQVEQWYRMNKAGNLAQWEAAVRMQAIPMFNCTYADRKGNIFYVYQALLPLRNGDYDWKKYLPGTTSRTLWTKYLPYDNLPQVKNPASGFVMNCNNTPWHTTLDPENPRKEKYSPAFGIEDTMTNRAYRALELFGSDPSITEEKFYIYKYDTAYSKKSRMAKMVRRLCAIPLPDTPDLNKAREILNNWNLRTDPENTSAALAVMSYTFILGPWLGKQRDLDEASDESMREGLEKAVSLLKDKQGKIDVPWQQVNRLIRGTVDLGLGGGPDVLRAVYGDLMKDGRLKGKLGDSYVLMVAWDKNGRVHSRSIHQYGSATLGKKSPHYADQAYLFVKCELRPVWRDEAEIRKHLEREYRPGEEPSAP